MRFPTKEGSLSLDVGAPEFTPSRTGPPPQFGGDPSSGACVWGSSSAGADPGRGPT